MNDEGDPGPCPICGAAHTTCGGPDVVTIAQLPQRDAVPEPPAGETVAPAPVEAEPVTTDTYRGPPGRKARR